MCCCRSLACACYQKCTVTVEYLQKDWGILGIIGFDYEEKEFGTRNSSFSRRSLFWVAPGVLAAAFSDCCAMALP